MTWPCPKERESGKQVSLQQSPPPPHCVNMTSSSQTPAQARERMRRTTQGEGDGLPECGLWTLLHSPGFTAPRGTGEGASPERKEEYCNSAPLGHLNDGPATDDLYGHLNLKKILPYVSFCEQVLLHFRMIFNNRKCQPPPRIRVQFQRQILHGLGLQHCL